MSSELRVKKLRGSGGYVIAALTDEQQSRASIGGPDLFLAPLCRMDTEKISKHQCTMCDKEYEGAPNIEYETPDEEVAPGLVLVEKGRYKCNTCESTIAEYREFKKEELVEDSKPVESAGEPVQVLQQQQATEQTIVGNSTQETVVAAAPQQQQQQQPEVAVVEATAPQQQQQPEVAEATAPQQQQQPEVAVAAAETVPQQQQQPEVAEATAPQQQQQQESEETQSQSQESPQTVSAIEGRVVYDENATKAGTVKQIGINASGDMVMIITRGDGTEDAIPWSRIKKIGEIVMLGDGKPAAVQQQQPQVQAGGTDMQQQQPQPVQQYDPGMCSKCSFKNRKDSKFCEECGAQL